MFNIHHLGDRYLLVLLFIYIFVFLGGGNAFGEDNTCHFKLTASEPEVSESNILMPVVYRYKATYDESCRLNVVRIIYRSMECAKPQIELGPSELMSQLTANVSVTCQFRNSGYFYLPPVEFEVMDNRDEQGRMIFYPSMNVVKIGGYKEIPDEIDLNKLLELQLWKKNQRGMWLIFFFLGVVVLFVVLAAHSRMSRSKTLQTAEPELKPIERFLAEVSRLVDESPATMEEYKSYHDRLSGAFRVFVSERYGFPGLNCTTSQFCDHLKALNISEELCEEAHRLLGESDCIKFAQEIPSQAANLLLLRDTGYLASRLEDIMVRRDNEELLKSEGSSPNTASESAE